MSTSIPSLERVEFFPSQLLEAEDLTTLDSNYRELRWLHNRTLHDWGICYGFNVSGARGDTSVTVSPGYANDITGHELIQSSPVQKPIPAIPGNSDGSPAIYYIVADYVDDADEPVVEQRSATACAQGGAVRLTNAPAINWKTAAQLDFGIDVVLGQVSIQNCALNAAVSTTGRRSAVPVSKPSLYAAAIDVQNLTWASMNSAGFTTQIDTSAAKFQSTPSYMAQIIGPRAIPNSKVSIADFVSVANPSPTGFQLQLALPPIAEAINTIAITDPVNGPKLMAQLGWSVSWIGVEA